nr:protein ALP1-like [Parasteatoda tepidariorum]
MVDANLKFIYVDIGTNGRVSDGGVFHESTLKNNIEQKNLNLPGWQFLPDTEEPAPFVIVADDAFPLEEYLLKPYPGKFLDLTCRILNYRLSRARRVSENAFGIWASRFRIFQTPILTGPAKAKQIILAAYSLHNFLRSRCFELYSPIPCLDR